MSRWSGFAVAVAGALVAGSTQAQDPRQVVAVLGLQNKGATLKAPVVDRMSEYISSQLWVSGRYMAVPSAQVKQALSRRPSGGSAGCHTEACQIEVGKVLAARKVVAGKILKIGRRCIVTLTLIDLPKSAREAVGSGRGACTEDGVLESIDAALGQLLGTPNGGAAGPVQQIALTPPPAADPQGSARPRTEAKRRLDTSETVAGMVRVPAGPFFMGCNKEVDSECADDEKPGRNVRVEAFLIDKTEVTVAAYRECVKAGACSAGSLTTAFLQGKVQTEWTKLCNWGAPARERHPINCLSWAQAKAYCEWKKKRLPTEEEWEKAARGADGRKYPWGNERYGRALVANIADVSVNGQYPKLKFAEGYDDGFVATAPVGRFSPAGDSPYGAKDMVGNVWEWTSDWYTQDKLRTVRGGSWFNDPPYARAGQRNGADPTERGASIGVRCAMSD